MEWHLLARGLLGVESPRHPRSRGPVSPRQGDGWPWASRGPVLLSQLGSAPSTPSSNSCCHSTATAGPLGAVSMAHPKTELGLPPRPPPAHPSQPMTCHRLSGYSGQTPMSMDPSIALHLSHCQNPIGSASKVCPKADRSTSLRPSPASARPPAPPSPLPRHIRGSSRSAWHGDKPGSCGGSSLTSTRTLPPSACALLS